MNQFNPFFVGSNWALIYIIIAVWTLFWKGCALWIAGKRDQKWWFLVLLIVNTAGILEIVYIFYVAKKKWADIQEMVKMKKSTI